VAIRYSRRRQLNYAPGVGLALLDVDVCIHCSAAPGLECRHFAIGRTTLVRHRIPCDRTGDCICQNAACMTLAVKNQIWATACRCCLLKTCGRRLAALCRIDRRARWCGERIVGREVASGQADCRNANSSALHHNAQVSHFGCFPAKSYPQLAVACKSGSKKKPPD
jgi:hypothetical protein